MSLISEIGNEIIRLDEVTSTNDYASNLLKSEVVHGTVVVTQHQTQGRGQRGNSWESKTGENLLFSIILKPNFLKVQRQFLISKIAALAVCDTISQVIPDVTIKWPNDIYTANDKIAGILIENSFSSEFLDTTIVGIGVNVNQSSFSDDLPNPTSLLLKTDREHYSDVLLANICKAFEARYTNLKLGNIHEINLQYFNRLFRSQGFNHYSSHGENFMARIVGVRDSGEIVLETPEGTQREFAFKEVCFAL